MSAEAVPQVDARRVGSDIAIVTENGCGCGCTAVVELDRDQAVTFAKRLLDLTRELT